MEIVQCGKIIEMSRKSPSVQEHWKTGYYWEVTKRKDVLHLIDLFLPWLGERRRGKIEESFILAEHWRSREPSH